MAASPSRYVKVRGIAGFVVLGLLVFLVVVVAATPISALTDRLPPGIQCEGVEGTLGEGSVNQLTLNGAKIGTLHWRFLPSALLQGELAYEVSASHDDALIDGRAGITLTGVGVVRDLRVNWPLEALVAPDMTGVWGGRLTGHLDTVRIESGWPTRILGTIEILHLHAPNSNLDQGSYALVFTPAPEPKSVHADVKDTDGPLAVTATLTLGANRSYDLKGALTPREGTPETLKDSFSMLGPPDANGRREFDLAGSL